ncbi:MAG: NUDIX domain-containing protein [Candidatus Micrarchaeales archaeon]|jgi:8-oxo-dGTP pyrophosphatase MutT (NUDIX family)|uniref:NUDIX hydrolase n=1 Tax=Candidatus Micrarchaeum acidiphilum ARMAN-2 TaxID=425595 RepID=C7DGQ3_MICA2|nr:MAG: NUDIX hydrolase [Candidatus Micrarchaeum acidiphilum ARMAN-2]MCW6161192.1 NUDIX domain-containing protein [Candidatus Micrarchaeales archaeon]
MTEEIVGIMTRISQGYLFLKRNLDDFEGGKFNCPAGHIEKGETAIEAALRELKEEAGIVAAPSELIYVDTFSDEIKGIDFRVRLFAYANDRLDLSDIKLLPQEHCDKIAIGADAVENIALVRTDRPTLVFTKIDYRVMATYLRPIERLLYESKNRAADARRSAAASKNAA